MGSRRCARSDKGSVIEPGKTVKLAPGGYHLMLMDLKTPQLLGDKVPLTWSSKKPARWTLSLEVQGVGAQGLPGGKHDHSGMKK